MSKVSTRKKELLAKIDTMFVVEQLEQDNARLKEEVERFFEQNALLKAELDRRKQKHISRTIQELRKTGNHHPDCVWWKWDHTYSFAPEDCTCDQVGALDKKAGTEPG